MVIELRGQPVTCTLFSLRLSFSGRAVHWVFLSADKSLWAWNFDANPRACQVFCVDRLSENFGCRAYR